MKQSKIPAFSISEAFVGLIIVAMMLSVTSMLVANAKKQYPLNRPRNINWQRILHNLENNPQPIRWVQIEDQGHQLIVQKYSMAEKEQKKYIIRQTKTSHRLYMSGIDGGFMPLLGDVKVINFNNAKGRIVMEVVFLDGEIKKANLSIRKVS